MQILILALSFHQEIESEIDIDNCHTHRHPADYPPNPSGNPSEDPRDPTINGTEACKHTSVENCILCKANSSECLCNEPACYWNDTPCVDCHGSCWETPLDIYCENCIDDKMSVELKCKECKDPDMVIIGDNCVYAGICLEEMPNLTYEENSSEPQIIIT